MCLGEAVDVRVESGFLKVVGSIPVVSSKEEIEKFVSEIHFVLTGSKDFQRKSSRELSEAEAAAYIGRSRSFLLKCRNPKYAGKEHYRGPKYTRVSPRGIRYNEKDLDEWKARNPKYESN